ncbi:MAG: polyprenyl synthetase family protein [Defluviitaleaceae bacterium]|nr:polyprenyl synthetase family protein [Defluviitaleaceae bacterium]
MIKILSESGFCHGVKAAVHRARALSERGGQVYLYGDLTNNRHVMAGFLRDGYIVAESAEEIPDGATVVIRAHGMGRGVYDAFSTKNAEIIDCTCVKVKKIHEIVAKKERVIVIGKKNHPEVLGILGWCKSGTVAENEAELLAALSSTALCASTALCTVAQTTCKIEWWEKAVEIINKKSPQAEIFNTLCDVTGKKIESAVEMARQSDAMVVVGDKKSANSVELFEACGAACKTVLFVSSMAELSTDVGKLAGAEKIGIAGSASSPAETVEEIHDYLLFARFLAATKTEIEEASDNYFKKLLDAHKGSAFIPDAIRDLNTQNQGGKRIRGTMIRLGYLLASPIKTSKSFEGGTPPQGLKHIELAYEIFQTAILIHDDVIDKSETRRGKPTIHVGESDEHFGVSRAICIGDYGLFLANRIIAEAGLDSEVLVRVMRLFADIQLKTLEGEIMDVSLPVFPVADADEYELTVLRIYEFKTAWYTLVGPAMLGAVCAGVELDDGFLLRLRDILLPLGVAFQIKDDLLGVFGREKELGKPALSDIIENKQTILYGFARKYACADTQNALAKSYGNPKAMEADLEAVREIFVKTGAKKFAEDEITRLSEIAGISIREIEEEHRPLLRGLVNFLLTRRT